MSRFLAVLAVLCTASLTSAQIIYQPVQYQWGGQNPFYYGGSNPGVIARGNQPACGDYGRVHGWAFISSNLMTHREVSTEPLRVFTDCVGRGYANAAIYGYSISDARNEAYASVPRFFRMHDLLAGAWRDVDGSIVVPPTAPLDNATGTIEIKPYVRPMLHEPHPVLIIPKRLLDDPAPQTPKKIALFDRAGTTAS